MKWSIVGLVIFGLLAALAASVLVAMLSVARTPPKGIASEPETVKVIVAAHDLPGMSVVAQGDVTELTIPRNKVPEDAVTLPVEAIGKVLALPVVQGKAFSKKDFVTEGGPQAIATSLSPGKRAVAISVSDYAGLEGVLYPGCVVDILCTIKGKNGPTTATLLERVQVLGIERLTIVSKDTKDDAGHHGNRRVTLLVDAKQAKIIQLAATEGTISLALRNPLDQTASDKTPVSLAALVPSLAPSAMGGPIASDEAKGFFSALMANAATNATRPAAEPKVEPTIEPTATTATAPATNPAVAREPEKKPEPMWQTIIIKGSAVETVQFAPASVEH